jgi:hypothetical protein
MIIKILFSKIDHKIYFKSKPSHNGRDRQYNIEFEQEPTKELLDKMMGKNIAYFHAHMKEDLLVLDDKIENQQW